MICMPGLRTIAIAAAASSLLATAAAAQDLRIGAMPVGSGWYVAGATLEKVLEPVLEGASIEVIPRGGGVANPMVVENGDAEIALSNVSTANWARKGHEIYGGQEATHIRALVGGLNPVYISAMVREAYIEETELDSLDEILSSEQPLRIVMKPQGSNVPPTVDLILEAYGLDREDIAANGGEIIQVDSSQIPGLIRDGRADVYFDTVLKGHPTITEVSLTGDVRFLDIPEKARAILAENGMRPAEIPQWFEGQDGPTWGADSGTVLIAHESVPEETAYQITKTVVENMSEMAKAYPAWAAFVPENAWKPENTGIPLHPGAERYYRERGWM